MDNNKQSAESNYFLNHLVNVCELNFAHNSWSFVV